MKKNTKFMLAIGIAILLSIIAGAIGYLLAIDNSGNYVQSNLNYSLPKCHNLSSALYANLPCILDNQLVYAFNGTKPNEQDYKSINISRLIYKR